MLFSSIAAVHGVALAAVRGRGTVDLDIIPVFAITGVLLDWPVGPSCRGVFRPFWRSGEGRCGQSSYLAW